ncbi:uncharacterized protein LOC143146146 [Ptiloglossa arizonensis]|uniref:uncharacterized protein LOC143146146 n=1 Tax=Ptiloglossa arizonensis TaxID=3350558 RepID=UPI003FA0BF37
MVCQPDRGSLTLLLVCVTDAATPLKNLSANIRSKVEGRPLSLCFSTPPSLPLSLACLSRDYRPLEENIFDRFARRDGMVKVAAGAGRGQRGTSSALERCGTSGVGGAGDCGGGEGESQSHRRLGKTGRELYANADDSSLDQGDIRDARFKVIVVGFVVRLRYSPDPCGGARPKTSLRDQQVGESSRLKENMPVLFKKTKIVLESRMHFRLEKIHRHCKGPKTDTKESSTRKGRSLEADPTETQPNRENTRSFWRLIAGARASQSIRDRTGPESCGSRSCFGSKFQREDSVKYQGITHQETHPDVVFLAIKNEENNETRYQEDNLPLRIHHTQPLLRLDRCFHRCDHK